MRKMKEKEIQLLSKICRENGLPMKLVSELLKSANKFSYENTVEAARLKEYRELIDFYGKDIKGGLE
ncbi:DNA modification system-associated small protein [Paenibacillus sp.]|uniref:DNA modification system-associated small protein n=1 Tax=Paenibacillus sp. TaxID=58172 RepID=UPI002D420F29|nr:DNA modification system-associated small protein [Paenibacillus sp.]HZG86240.1 DNA modification system-associated small protein [Paenibacillus sp.]